VQAVAGKPYLIQSLTNVPNHRVWEGREKKQSKRENANFVRFHAKIEWLDWVPFENLSLAVKNSTRARSIPFDPRCCPENRWPWKTVARRQTLTRVVLRIDNEL
jgi:hypothetical protein